MAVPADSRQSRPTRARQPTTRCGRHSLTSPTLHGVVSTVAAEGNIKRKESFAHLLLLAVGALATVIFTAAWVQPLFKGERVVAGILRHAYVDSTEIHAPWLRSSTAEALGTPQFLADRERFMRDLLRTGKVEERRAWQLADVAVREAYRRRLPPALVLGVMMTENDELDSSARSRVGAVGLMQIHGRPWRRTLGPLFGTNLRNDTTNLRYGVFILGYVARRAAAAERDTSDSALVASDSSWRVALLRYNGCVTGRNTPNCRSYPLVVQRNVIDHARTTCNGRDFDACVVRPLWLSTRDP